MCNNFDGIVHFGEWEEGNLFFKSDLNICDYCQFLVLRIESKLISNCFPNIANISNTERKCYLWN